MPVYEYKVVPAPLRGRKAKGLKGTQARFAHALEQAMNELAAEGWEYLRAETLPCEERISLMRRNTRDLHVLVFRRARAESSEDAAPHTMKELIHKLAEEPSDALTTLPREKPQRPPKADAAE
ncbi:DUF4177 domain-containing protein [Candidatus Halocynthiibacter alkanivorans]|uniref:DUF4177 domain-containing protein n=1 Tax=Candidatus Halocynthiibacter alkanivorans TaxID=2267619 RepID=UPI000DF14897|nr:DUF4177 domain-containing protein [Candidatus Halocynthiibacter alkanivorans]